MMYLAIKELSSTAEDVIMVTSSIQKDMQPNLEVVVPNYAAARTIHSHPRSPCQHLPYLRSYLHPRRRQVPFRSTCKARTDRVRRRRLRLRFRSLRRLNLLGHSRCLQSRPARTINIHNSPICLQIAKTVLIRSATGVTSGEFLRVLARRRF